MRAPNAITEREPDPPCACCGEAPGAIRDCHIGYVCGSCAGRLASVEHVLMPRICGYSGECDDPRKTH